MNNKNDNVAEAAPSVFAPVLQLFIILIPTVANGFLLVYFLLGMVLEDKQFLLWVEEARLAGLYVCLAIWGFSLLVLTGIKLLGLDWRRPLAVVSFVQIAIAGVMYLFILAIAGF